MSVTTLFIALGKRDQQLSTVTVADVMHGRLFYCNPDDDAEAVLEIMKTQPSAACWSKDSADWC